MIGDFLSRCSVVDVESTSPDANTCDIIELACSVYAPGTQEWVVFDDWFKPTIPIPALSAEKHFIRDMDVQDKPQFSSFMSTPLATIAKGVDYFVAHNAKYDRTAIVNNMARFGLSDTETNIGEEERWFCTYRLSQKIFNNDPNIESHRLTYLWFQLGLCNSTNKMLVPHKADSDIFMAGKLFELLVLILIDRGIVDPSKDIGSQVWEYQNSPIEITHFPFGKHKGVPMDEVPTSYLEWCVANMDTLNEESDSFDPDFTAAVVKQFERR